MKLFLVLGFLLCSPLHALTLKEAQELAINNSPNLKTLNAQLAEADARARVFAQQGRPIVGIAGGAELEGTSDEQDVLPLAYGYISYNLYDGKQIALRQKQAALDGSSLKRLMPVEVIELRLRVSEKFQHISYLRMRRKLLEKELSSFSQLKKKAAKRLNAGLIGRADVLEFDLRSTELAIEIESVEEEERGLLNQLKALVGQDIEVSISDLPSIRAIAVDEIQGDSTSAAQILMEREREAGKIEGQIQSTLWSPRIDLEGRAGRLPSEGEIDKHKPRLDALLIAKWDLWTQGQRSTVMNETAAQDQRLSFALEQQKAEREIKKAEVLGALKLLQLKSESQKRRKIPAQRYYQAMMEEYGRGVKNSPDVAHAAETVFEIDQDLLENQYLWGKALIEFQLLIGKELES